MGGCTSSPEKEKKKKEKKAPKQVLKKASFKYERANDTIFTHSTNNGKTTMTTTTGVVAAPDILEIKDSSNGGVLEINGHSAIDLDQVEESVQQQKMTTINVVTPPTIPTTGPPPPAEHPADNHPVSASLDSGVSPEQSQDNAISAPSWAAVVAGDVQRQGEALVTEAAKSVWSSPPEVTRIAAIAVDTIESYQGGSDDSPHATVASNNGGVLGVAAGLEMPTVVVSPCDVELVETSGTVADAQEETSAEVIAVETLPVKDEGGGDVEDEVSMASDIDIAEDFEVPSQVENILKPLELSNDDYHKVMDLMYDDLVKGLTPDTHASSNIKCFPTYVRSVPDGSETGDFLALDLGGTNFRVLLINLNKEEVTMESKIYIIPPHIMLGTGNQLFDHIADCIFKFMSDQQLLGRQLPLGFTFSFPCRQVGLDKAILTTWTKGFRCEGVEGNDIVQLLHAAIERRGDMSNVRCLAVINDTVGALMSCAHSDRQCAIGLILGTGTNACYIDALSEVRTWDGDTEEPKQVLINTEWGAFGNDGNLDFILTDFDKSIDKHSINPGRQIYEKMISGMYMGEIARLAIERLRKHNLLFEGEGSYHLSTRGRFYTKYVSEIEGDDVDSFTVTKQIFEELELTNFTEQDCRLVRHVCSLVSKRAAYLASAGIACLLNKMGRPDVTVGVDGSLYRFHPFFHELMIEKIKTLTKSNIQFKLMLSHDGSGKGAALVAAVANRLLQEKNQRNAESEQNGNAVASEH